MSVLNENLDAWIDWSVESKPLVDALLKFKANPTNDTHDVVANIIKQYCVPTTVWSEYDNVILLNKDGRSHRNTIVMFARPIMTQYNKPHVVVWRCWPKKPRVCWEWEDMHAVSQYLASSEWAQEMHDAYTMPEELVAILRIELNGLGRRQETYVNRLFDGQ